MRSLLVFDEVEEEWQETVVCGIAKVLERLAPVGLYEFELLCPLPYFLSFFFSRSTKVDERDMLVACARFDQTGGTPETFLIRT